MKESVTINLPAGFAVDEVPDPVTLDTDFGKYATSYQVTDNKLIFTRSLLMNRKIVPASQYAAVKDFFSKMLAADQAPVVLIKK
jgi:hypothetical protein